MQYLQKKMDAHEKKTEGPHLQIKSRKRWKSYTGSQEEEDESKRKKKTKIRPETYLKNNLTRHSTEIWKYINGCNRTSLV